MGTGRYRFRFTKARTSSPYVVLYDVELWALSAVAAPQVVTLGQVERVTVSTDTTRRYAGVTRPLRRPGKGRPAWRARVLRADGKGTMRARCELQHCYGGGYRLEYSGQNFATRAEAAEALRAWNEGDRFDGDD